MRQSGQSCLSITVSVMISLQPSTQQIHQSFLSSLNSCSLHFCLALILVCQCLRFLRPLLISSTFSAGLSKGGSAPWSRKKSRVAKLGYNKTGRSSSANPSHWDTWFILHLETISISVCCHVNARPGPKGHTFSFSRPTSTCLSSWDAPGENSRAQIPQPERGSAN